MLIVDTLHRGFLLSKPELAESFQRTARYPPNTHLPSGGQRSQPRRRSRWRSARGDGACALAPGRQKVGIGRKAALLRPTPPAMHGRKIGKSAFDPAVREFGKCW